MVQKEVYKVRERAGFKKSKFYSKDKQEVQRNWIVVKAAHISLFNK